jgi:hypothetical protein
MNKFKHELPYVEAIVNAVMRKGVQHARIIKNGKLGIYKLDRLTVVGYIDREDVVYEIVMRNGSPITTDLLIKQFQALVEEVKFSVNNTNYLS